MIPCIILWQIPSEGLKILGDEEGKLHIIKYLERCNEFCWSETLRVILTDDGAAVYTMGERIPIQKHVLAGRWGVRCGYGPKSRTWAIRTTEAMDLQEISSTA